MAVTSKDEILNKVKGLLPDSTTDDALSLFEDITDTFDSISSASADSKPEPEDKVDWQKKYEENDKAWREKYRERFFSTETDDDPTEPDPQDSTNLGEVPEKKMSYSDLFKESD